MTAAAISVSSLFKVLYASLAAGVGVAIVFSVAILGATRASDMRRCGRSGAATAYGVLAAVGFAASAAIAVYGLILVGRK